MAIQRPYNVSIQGLTIDGNLANTISWSISGSISTAFAITIQKNSDNTVVYSLSKTTSYAVSYTLPANTLTNGLQYKITIQVWDENNNTATSDPVIFQTSSTPVVTINTIGTVGNSSNNFTANYSQAESLSIKSWSAFLYDSNNNLLGKSDLQTTTTLQYIFYGLENGKSYFVEFQATSTLGLVGTSGKISFNVSYASPNLTTNLTAENVDNAGIQLSWNVTQIIGQSQNSSFIGGEKLDTRNGKAWFNQGFDVADNFTLKTWIEGVTNLTITNNTELIVSKDAPSNINSLWLSDPTQTTPNNISISVSNVIPSNQSNLWIGDYNQTAELVLNAYINIIQPSGSYAWLGSESSYKLTRLMNLVGNNGSLSIEYYNGNFNLVSYDSNNNRTVLSTYAATGNQFYVYIQQIGNSYNLGATVLS